MILDSVGPNGKRIVTVEHRCWRAIHAEYMTHRDRARNAASSRAIPFIRYKKCDRCGSTGIDEENHYHPEICRACSGQGKVVVDNCTYSRIRDDAFFPEFMGTEQKGMQSGGELIEPNRQNCLDAIKRMRDYCLKECEYLFEQGLHKSIINRYLEPFSYITVVTTATEWKNFFRLRVHPKAEKHFQKVARQIKDAIDASVPQVLKAREWHLPYITKEDRDEVESLSISELEALIQERRLGECYYPELVLKRVSAAYCARLSYLNHEGKRDLKDSVRLFGSLIHPKIEVEGDDDVIHSSPLEHVAQALRDKCWRSGPFIGWHQFRKDWPNENVEGM